MRGGKRIAANGSLREIAEVIASRQEKMLVFTRFRAVIDPLAAFLAGIFGRPGLTLHGETEVRKRKPLVRDSPIACRADAPMSATARRSTCGSARRGDGEGQRRGDLFGPHGPRLPAGRRPVSIAGRHQVFL